MWYRNSRFASFAFPSGIASGSFKSIKTGWSLYNLHKKKMIKYIQQEVTSGDRLLIDPVDWLVDGYSACYGHVISLVTTNLHMKNWHVLVDLPSDRVCPFHPLCRSLRVSPSDPDAINSSSKFKLIQSISFTSLFFVWQIQRRLQMILPEDLSVPNRPFRQIRPVNNRIEMNWLIGCHQLVVVVVVIYYWFAFATIVAPVSFNSGRTLKSGWSHSPRWSRCSHHLSFHQSSIRNQSWHPNKR